MIFTTRTSQTTALITQPEFRRPIAAHAVDAATGGGRRRAEVRPGNAGRATRFRTPLRLALKLLMNTALGFLALWAVNATAAVTGVALGLNLLNALTVGVLGLPGFVLLLLAQWVL